MLNFSELYLLASISFSWLIQRKYLVLYRISVIYVSIYEYILLISF